MPAKRSFSNYKQENKMTEPLKAGVAVRLSAFYASCGLL